MTSLIEILDRAPAPENGNDEYMLRFLRERGRLTDVTFIEEPPAEEIFCPIISADDHCLEPPTLFTSRVPAALVDQVPFIEVDDSGLPLWMVDGMPVPVVMANGACGRDKKEWGLRACTYEEFRAGVIDSAARLPDMDMVGLWGSLCFPSTVWGFAGTRLSKLHDQEAGFACVQAYNDWMIEEWCAAAPDRYIPCQMPWLADGERAAGEIYRNAERRFRAVSFSENPQNLGFPSVYNPYWDPFFRACEETETVVNLHVGSSGNAIIPSRDSADAVPAVLFPISGLITLVDWIFALVPVRFPNLKVALSEAGASWVPMALERLERSDRLNEGIGTEWPADAPPKTELATRNFYFTSIEDPHAFANLDIIGEDHVMVETDYPHFDSTWPDSQAMIRRELEGLPGPLIRKLCYENAARLYRVGLPPQSWIEDSTHYRAELAGR